MLAHALIGLLQLEPVFLVQRDAELEGVDRIEAEAVLGEQRRVVADVLGLQVLEVQRVDHQDLQFTQKLVHSLPARW
mgnify:CR=1 FL=1